MLERAGEFMDNGSDYVVDNLEKLEIYTCTYNPVGGSSYIVLPKFLADKKCIINVKNEDDELCFAYSILAQLYPSKSNKNKVVSYKKHLGKLNFLNIDVPVKLSDIPRFERQNPTISIGVQTLDESNRVVPLYASEYRHRPHHINLFYLTEFPFQDSADGVKHHYCLVTDLSRLLSSATVHKHKCIPCTYCLHRFYSQYAFERHAPLCIVNPPCRIIFPSNKIKVRKGDLDADEIKFGEIETVEELLGIDADEI